MGNRYLVLDTRVTERTQNAKLVVAPAEKDRRNPLFGEDKPWEQRFDNLYPNAMYDRQEGLYKCWYSPFISDLPAKSIGLAERQRREYNPPKGREMGLCYATSEDGIVWDKPELGHLEFEGSTENNLVIRTVHGSGVLKEDREQNPAKRYKVLTSCGRKGLGVSFSPDGVRWEPPTLCPAINPYRVDGTHYNVLWVEELGEYVGFTRMRDPCDDGLKEVMERHGAWPPRQVGRTTSKDFLNWTQATAVMQGSDENLQIYSMPVFRHGSVYLGLPVIHNQRTDRAWTELAWSPDTVEWRFVCPGSPLIPNSDEVGGYDWGCAYSSAYPIVLEDEIRLYYGASNWLHFGWRDGFLCLARLRPDGFAGYEQVSAKRPAVVTTKPMAITGSALHLSADVYGVGSVQVRLLNRADEEVIAESQPIGQTVTDGVVTWQNSFTFSSVMGENIRIEFGMNGAKLYSFGFDLKP